MLTTYHTKICGFVHEMGNLPIRAQGRQLSVRPEFNKAAEYTVLHPPLFLRCNVAT